MTKLKLTAVGTSTGAVIPKEMLTRHSLSMPGLRPDASRWSAPLAAPGSAEWNDRLKSLPGNGTGPGRQPRSSASVLPPARQLGRCRVRLKVGKGDALYAVETAEGYLLTSYDPQIEEQLKAGGEFMRSYRDTFRALAK